METLVVNAKALRLSEDDFFNLCVQNRDIRFERDKDQNIIVMSPTGSYMGEKNFSLYLQLGAWNNNFKQGYCFDSSTGFTLPNGAVRSPDAAWIKKERWEMTPVEDRKKFAHLCPDFVIELKSESDYLKNLQDKMQEWITNGCRLGGLIDLEDENVYVYKPGAETKIISGFNNKISGEDVLSGFMLDLSELKQNG